MNVMTKPLAGGARKMGQTGMTISRLGYGAMELAGAPLARDLTEQQAVDFINRLIDSGVNYIDTSIDYGLSERLIGKVMKHRRGEIKEKKAEAPPGRGERSEKNKNTDRNSANHPEKARENVSLINMSQTGNDTEHHCDSVAGLAFRGLCCAAHPIAAVTASRVFR